MTTVALIAEERILLEGVNWEAYEALLQSWAHRAIRLTYDHRKLEIMSPLHSHEQYGTLIGRLVFTFCEELDLPVHSGGSTTFKIEAKQRGLEPDECYWIQHELRMRGKKEFDIQADPPPDLAIEVDITSSSLDRMSIYASLAIPEVWRFDGELLTIHLLQASEHYEETDTSLALPKLPPVEVMRFLELSNSMDEISWLKTFRAWVREEILPPRKKRAKRARRPPKK